MKTALSRWLAAERQGDESAAERALAAAFRGAGRPRPAVGFAVRTLERAGLGVPGRLLPAWLLKGGLVAALALTAMSTALVPTSLTVLAASGDRMVGAGIGLLAAVFERLAHGVAAWGVAARISRSLVENLADPALLGALGLSMLMSLLAFSWLSQLLALERSAEHV